MTLSEKFKVLVALTDEEHIRNITRLAAGFANRELYGVQDVADYALATYREILRGYAKEEK